MKVGIIGAGFTGLSAALTLSKMGESVEIFEKEDNPGGLAIGFKDNKWEWPLEQHYHHLFTSDGKILDLARDLDHTIEFNRPLTKTFASERIYQLDSISSLLSFPPLSLGSRIRTGIGLASIKFNHIWRPLEALTAENYIKTVFGAESWHILWKPLMEGKFGEYSSRISAAWFWSRIYKRSESLGYPVGGFWGLAKTMESKLLSCGVTLKYNTSVVAITLTSHNKPKIHFSNGKYSLFDKVICTLPTPFFSKLTNLSYSNMQGLGAINLVVALKEKFFSDGTYWLNINDREYPFLALVEHTNFQSPKHYGGDNLLYIGNYLQANHRFFGMDSQQLQDIFVPFMEKINPKFSPKSIRKSWVWKAPFAQPVVTKWYSKKIPPLKTSMKNVFLANIQQVYPWDRGTNYAVELGDRVARLCLSEK